MSLFNFPFFPGANLSLANTMPNLVALINKMRQVSLSFANGNNIILSANVNTFTLNISTFGIVAGNAAIVTQDPVAGTITVAGFNLVAGNNISISENVAAGTWTINANSGSGPDDDSVITSNLVVWGNLTINGLSNLVGNVSTVGFVNVGTTLQVAGNSVLNGTLNVAANTSLAATLNVAGNTVLTGTLNTTGNVVFSSTLNVTANATFSANVNVAGVLNVTGNVAFGNTHIKGTLLVDGNTTLSDRLVMSSADQGLLVNVSSSNDDIYCAITSTVSGSLVFGVWDNPTNNPTWAIGNHGWIDGNPGILSFRTGNIERGQFSNTLFTVKIAANLQSTLNVAGTGFFGTNALTQTATPAIVSLGGTYCGTAGASVKVKVLENPFDQNNYGFTVSSNATQASLESLVPAPAQFGWYVANVAAMYLSANTLNVVTANVFVGHHLGVNVAPASLAAVKVVGEYFSQTVNLGTLGSTLTIDWSQGNEQYCVLNANITFTFSNPEDGGRYVLAANSGTGAFTITWPATVLWNDNRAPVMSQPANKLDLYVFQYFSVINKYIGAYSQYYG